MIDPLFQSIQNSSIAIKNQSIRLRVISENIANAQSTSVQPGGDPYQRKMVVFDTFISDLSSAKPKIVSDKSPFKVIHDPGNSAANENGDVKMPNVDDLIEMADLKDANKSYLANLQIIKATKDLMTQTLDLLKG